MNFFQEFVDFGRLSHELLKDLIKLYQCHLCHKIPVKALICIHCDLISCAPCRNMKAS